MNEEDIWIKCRNCGFVAFDPAEEACKACEQPDEELAARYRNYNEFGVCEDCKSVVNLVAGKLPAHHLE